MNKMKLKSLTALLIAIVMLLSACGTGSGAKVRLTENDIIGDDGYFLYNIIYENDLSDDANQEVRNLREQIKESFDIAVRARADSDKSVSGDGTYEILIGNTNRKESETALKALQDNREINLNDWSISVVGKKICVVAVDSNWLPKAVRYLTENFTGNLADLSKLTENFSYIYEAELKGKGMTIGGVSASEYILVASKEKSRVWATYMEQFVENLTENYNCKVEVFKDTLKEAQEYEILVGTTNRMEQEELDYKKFKIELKGTKLLISGGSNEALGAAFLYLIEQDKNALKAEKAFEIPAGYSYTGEVDTSAGYQMAWHDEFNGKTLDRTIWRNYNSEKGTTVAKSSMGGILYKPDARDTYVENGDWVIPVFRLNHTDFQQAGADTHDTLAARYGIIEIRAKAAPNPISTCFWGGTPHFQLDANGNRSPYQSYGLPAMELDISENFSNLDWYATNVHAWWANGGHTSLDGTKYGTAKKFKWTEDGDMSDDYHIYGVEWTPDYLSFSLDGDVFFTFDVAENHADWTRCPQRMQTGISYASVGYGQQYIPDDAPARAEARIDYWRIYQNSIYDNIMWVSPQPSQMD